MRKLLCVVFVLTMSIGFINAQNQSYTYQKYGIINQYTNNMVLEVDNILKLSKYKNTFFITINDLSSFSENSSGFNLVVSLKGYDELNEEYIYIGDAIEVVSKKESLIYKGKCLVKSNNKLDIYLNNQGHNFKDLLYNKELSFSVYFNNMRTDREGFIPQVPNTSIRIYPIRNKTEQEKREEALKEKQKKEFREKEEYEIKRILFEVNIEQKTLQIKNNIIDYYRQKTKDIILNTPIKQLLREKKELNKTASLNYEFELYIDKDKNVTIIKDKRTYQFPYYGYDSNNPLGDYKERRINPTLLALKDEYGDKYSINNQIYYKKDNDIFSDAYKLHKNIKFETDIIGIRAKKNYLKYYSNENKISQFEELHNWCSKNITDNGLNFIHYVIIDGEFSCKILDLNKEEIKLLKQYLKVTTQVSFPEN